MTQAVALAQQASTGVSQGFKNRIINGAMTIDQRNAGASVTTGSGGTYTLDRWQGLAEQASKFSVQQDAGAVTPPVGFTDYLGVTSLSAYSVPSGGYYAIRQAIEGFNVADLNWGTANAKTVTLSFWVRSSLTGTFGGVLQNSANNRSYPFTYTISSANTWEYETVTIAGDTTGTWLTTNGVGVWVMLGLGVGSTFSGTAGAWAGSNFISATGATSVVGTNGATFYITGVQFEVGTTATNFDFRSYGTELNLCQRYYQKLTYDGTGGEVTYGVGAQQGTTYAYVYTPYLQTMRSEPTAAISNLQVSNFRSYSTDCTLTSIQAGYSSCSIIYGFASSGSADAPVYVQNKNNVAGFLSFSAEL